MARQLVAREQKVYRIRVDPFTTFYTPRRFIARYRLTQEVVEELAAGFGASNFSTLGTRIGGGLSHRERVCIALRYYASGGLYSLIADSQNVSRSTVCRSVLAVSRYLQANHQQFIQWPSEDEYPDVARGFYELAAFPRVIGAMDGTHIPIKKPHIQERCYVNRKGFHSINVMAVCKSNMEFTYINPTRAGGAHDAYVYNNSQLATELEAGLANNYLLLGDSGYPLTHFLLTPLLGPENDAELRYTQALCRTRAVVENAFGALKMRFRCLDGSGGYIMSAPDVCSDMIVAICCCHNIAIRRGIPVINDIDPPLHMFQQPPVEIVNEVHPRGQERRQQLIEYFA